MRALRRNTPFSSGRTGLRQAGCLTRFFAGREPRPPHLAPVQTRAPQTPPARNPPTHQPKPRRPKHPPAETHTGRNTPAEPHRPKRHRPKHPGAPHPPPTEVEGSLRPCFPAGAQIVLAMQDSICALGVYSIIFIFSEARLAQSAERKALNLVVVRSSPTVGAFAFRNADVTDKFPFLFRSPLALFPLFSLLLRLPPPCPSPLITYAFRHSLLSTAIQRRLRQIPFDALPSRSCFARRIAPFVIVLK